MKLRSVIYTSALLLCLQLTAQPVSRYEFHSDFLVNLHHFLYASARSVSSGGKYDPPILPADAAEAAKLTDADQATWNAAVKYYITKFGRHDLLRDVDLRTIKDQLENGRAVPAELQSVLDSVATIYREHYWTRHDALNKKWIAQMQPVVLTHEKALSASLTQLFHAPWPGNPVRVDLVAYANWAGAYTTLYPTRPTVSSSEESSYGSSGLEIVFHETSHGMMDDVDKEIAAAQAALREKGGNPTWRPDLSHEVLFYTVGELVAARVPGHVPNADRGLWERAWPGPDRKLLEQDWRPYVRGEGTLQAAVARLVRDLQQEKDKTNLPRP